MFLAAAIGSAVGISNIWKFSYVAGENGGGAFVLVYVFATLFIALPVVVAEFLIGRRGRNGMEGSILVLAERDGISTRWRFYAYLALLGIFLALSFYCVVAWLEIRLTLSRPLLSLLVGLTIWVLGLATIFSFNIWSDVRLITFIPPVADKNIFGLLDYLVSNIIFPIGGICIALIAGWGLSKEATMQELGMSNTVVYRTWHVLVRYMVPGAVGAIFIANLA